MKRLEGGTYTLTLPGRMLQRGFWLYVWRVEAPDGTEWLYVGRTGDNSSPNAGAPYARMGQHLGSLKNQNALRARLKDQGIAAEECVVFHLVAHGPIYLEIVKSDGAHRDGLMQRHRPLRDEVGAYERELALALRKAGYNVLNTVRWKKDGVPETWALIKSAFSSHFPKLSAI